MTTPIERLRAAIEKLESQREASYGAGKYTWWVDPQEANMAFDAEVRAKGAPDGFHDGIAMVCDQSDAELIATLHRTIDAQLAMLREALDFAENSQVIGMPDSEIEEYYGNQRDLADAILGHSPAPALSEREFAEVARFGIHPELTTAEDW